MAETRHRTVVEVDVDASAAREKLADLLAIQQQLNTALGGGRSGGTTAPSGGAQPGGGAPPAGSQPSLPGGGAQAPGGGAPGARTQGPVGPQGGGAQPGGGAPLVFLEPGDRVKFGHDGTAYIEQPKESKPPRPRDMVMGIGQGAASALGAGSGAGLMLAQQGAQLAFDRIQNMGDAVKAAKDIPIIGPVIGTIAGVAKGVAAASAMAALVGGIGLQYRAGVASRRASLDEQNALAGMTGSGVSYGRAAGLGFTPEEAVSNAVAFSQGAGFSGAGATPLGLVRTGTSIGALAAYRGQMAAGAGGMGEASMRTAVALAQSSGLRGSRVDEYLQAIAANTGSLASQGLRTSIPGAEDFLRRAAVTPGLGGTGMGQVRALGAVTGAVGGARSQLLAPFQGLGENVLQGYAASRARSPVEAVQILEQLNLEPNKIVQVLRDSGLPPEAIQGYLMSKGLNSGEAAGVGMMNLTGETPETPGVRSYKAGPLKVAMAKMQAEEVGAIGASDVAIFESQAKVNAALLKLGEAALPVTEKLIGAIESLIQALK